MLVALKDIIGLLVKLVMAGSGGIRIKWDVINSIGGATLFQNAKLIVCKAQK